MSYYGLLLSHSTQKMQTRELSLARRLRATRHYALLDRIPDVRAWVSFGIHAPLLIRAPEGSFLPEDGSEQNPQTHTLQMCSLDGDPAGFGTLPLTAHDLLWPSSTEFTGLQAAGSNLAQCFVAVCRLANKRHAHVAGETSWQLYVQALERDRYEADAWFERDRKHLRLHDKLLGQDVVSLWDDQVDQAIDDGFLTAPRRPRPSSSDWLRPLLDYAGEGQILVDLRVDAAPNEDDHHAMRERHVA